MKNSTPAPNYSVKNSPSSHCVQKEISLTVFLICLFTFISALAFLGQNPETSNAGKNHAVTSTT